YKKALFLAIFHYKLLRTINCAFDDAPPAPPPQREGEFMDCHSDLTNPLAMTINTCLISFYFHHTYSKSLKTPHLQSVFFFVAYLPLFFITLACYKHDKNNYIRLKNQNG
ncbi:hypothetical protein, partial [Helicobacter sp. T3_23-1059]